MQFVCPHSHQKSNWWQNTCSNTFQNKLLLPIFNLVKFSLRPKNECLTLIAFKLSAALNALENGGHDISTSLIRKDNLIDSSLKHNLSRDS